MPRRVYDYVDDPNLVIMNQIATMGAYMMGTAMAVFLANMIHSAMKGKPAKMEDPFEIGEQYYDYRRREPHH
jgi:heme/copper-type cytochrome/quinol oxidase subunit 1